MSFREKNGGDRKNSLAVLFVCLQKLTFRELRGEALSSHLFIFSLSVFILAEERRESCQQKRGGWRPKSNRAAGGGKVSKLGIEFF